MILANVDEAVAAGARLNRVCEFLELPARTVQRWRTQGPDGGNDRRRGPHSAPKNKLLKAERERVLEVVNSKPYRDMSPKQIVPRLADKGLYLASESTVYRILEEAGQSRHRQPSKPRAHARPPERVATGPEQILCWDITYLPSVVRGQFFFLYVFLDIWSRKILGWGVHEEQCGKFASELLEALCDELNVSSDGIVLHSDNGKSMKGSSMLSSMQWLGIVPSFSRPGVSDDNPFIESLFRTMKYRPGVSGQRFASVEQGVEWAQHLVHWYNHDHLHSAIGFVTPDDRHNGRDIRLLAQRRGVYRQANALHPERWSGNVRRWSRPLTVRLNPGPDRDPLTLTPRPVRATA